MHRMHRILCIDVLKKYRSPAPTRPSPHPNRGKKSPWERGRPARILILMEVAERQRDFAGSHPVGVNLQRSNRERPTGPFRVDPSGGDGRGCASALCGRGRPRSQGGHHPHKKPGTWFTSCPGIGQGALCRPEDHSPLEGESARGRSPQSSRRGANATPGE